MGEGSCQRFHQPTALATEPVPAASHKQRPARSGGRGQGSVRRDRAVRGLPWERADAPSRRPDSPQHRHTASTEAGRYEGRRPRSQSARTAVSSVPPGVDVRRKPRNPYGALVPAGGVGPRGEVSRPLAPSEQAGWAATRAGLDQMSGWPCREAAQHAMVLQPALEKPSRHCIAPPGTLPRSRRGGDPWEGPPGAASGNCRFSPKSSGDYRSGLSLPAEVEER